MGDRRGFALINLTFGHSHSQLPKRGREIANAPPTCSATYCSFRCPRAERFASVKSAVNVPVKPRVY